MKRLNTGSPCISNESNEKKDELDQKYPNPIIERVTVYSEMVIFSNCLVESSKILYSYLVVIGNRSYM